MHYKFHLLLDIIDSTLETGLTTKQFTDNHHCLTNFNFHFAQKCNKICTIYFQKTVLPQSNFFTDTTAIHESFLSVSRECSTPESF